jgi:hypothetical protein
MRAQRPSLYRDHARQSRELAGRLPDSETRDHLFDMADLYDAIADISDRQPAQSLPKQTLSDFAGVE